MLNDATGLKKIYQGTLMGRGWVPASLQETEQRCLQLATFRRRGVGNIPGTIYDADARA